jgi:hypothetical protein
MAVSERYLKLVAKACSGLFKGKSAYIKAKCVECCGIEDVVDRIRNCSVKNCPLHPIRPFQQKESKKTPKSPL